MKEYYVLALIVQLSLGYGLAGLLWTDKVKGCTVLWFPFIPSLRAVRTSGVASIVFAALVFAMFVGQVR